LAAHPKTLPIPRLISNSDFDEICESFKISPKKNRDALRAVIDGATAGAAEFMKEQRSQPHRRDDRELVEHAISALNKAQRLLDRLGPHGKTALSIECERVLSPLVSTLWLCQRFRADSLAPQIAGLVADFNDRSLDQRRPLVGQRPLLVVNAILAELGRALNGSRLFLCAKAGRKRAIARHILICSLARAWNFIGRKVSTSPKSEFVQFVEAVLVSIGWSDSGIPDAVADAVRDLRNQSKKKVR
jgi:hypothetical protein